MPLFRLHRGSLQESLSTTIVIHLIKDIVKYIEYLHPELGRLKQIEIKIYGDSIAECFDKRIGWYTHTVSIATDAMPKLLLIGFLSEPISTKETK